LVRPVNIPVPIPSLRDPSADENSVLSLVGVRFAVSPRAEHTAMPPVPTSKAHTPRTSELDLAMKRMISLLGIMLGACYTANPAIPRCREIADFLPRMPGNVRARSPTNQLRTKSPRDRPYSVDVLPHTLAPKKTGTTQGVIPEHSDCWNQDSERNLEP